MKYGVALFHTTSSAMQAQKALNSKGYAVTLVPTPRQFSSDCGIAIRFNLYEQAQVKETLDKVGVEIQAIHEM
ncbi:MAG: DUF3343 domain-containing protein [Dehalococcoidales bacterium]|nr:DUF3343 domain-containing protein [Dehalococcoidales bacterium]